MKFEMNVLEEPLKMAVQTAVVAVAWPEFAKQFDGGNETPEATGSFALPVGHYLAAPSDDYVLAVSVELKVAFQHEGAVRFYTPGQQLSNNLASCLSRTVANMKVVDLVGKSVTCDEVSGDIAFWHWKGKNLNVEATATVTITASNRKLGREELIAKRAELAVQLGQLETSYPFSKSSENIGYEQTVQRLADEHARRLAEIETNYTTRKSELETELDSLDAQIAALPAEESSER